MIFKVKICGTAQSTLKSREICPPLSDRLIELGFEIEEDPQKANFLISVNHNEDIFDSFSAIGGKKENAVLLRLEPAAVFPAQYKSRIESLYGLIVTPGSFRSSLVIPWPYYFNQNPLHPDSNSPELRGVVSRAINQNIFKFEQWDQRPIKLSLIASNKVSPTFENNYKLRRRLAKSLPKETFEIYGALWNSTLSSRIRHRVGVLKFALQSKTMPNLFEIYGNLFRKYPAAVGVVRDKHEIVRKSKFSLIIENDNNYVSEKLIDALLGGSIPIYYGGDYQRVGIPRELVIADLNSEREVVDFIDNISKEEILNFQLKVQEWLQSPSFFQVWAGDHVFATIAGEIAQYFRKVVL